NGRETVIDDIERLIPGNALEIPLTLRTSAFKRIEQTIGPVHKLWIMADLAADGAVRQRIDIGTSHLHDLVTFHGNCQATGIRTIQGADAVLNLGHMLSSSTRGIFSCPRCRG